MINLESLISDNESRTTKGLHSVNVPQWGGEGFIRPMTVAQRFTVLELLQRAQDANGKFGNLWCEAQCRAIAYSLCDEKGNTLLKRWEELQEADPVVVDLLWSKVSEVSILDDAALLAAKKKFEVANSKT